MVRFLLRHNGNGNDDDDDDDDDDDSTSYTPESHALVEHVLNEEEYIPSSHFEDESAALPLPPEAPAFIVAYQRNGTPFLVPFDQPNKGRRKKSWRLWIVLVAVVIQVVLWYGPPAPPSADESWVEFFERETLVLGKAFLSLLSVIPHVGQWCLQAIRVDVSALLQPAPCLLLVPNDLSSTLQASMVGQPRAVSIATRALQAWQSSEEGEALILVLAGTTGVGKLRLAQQIAQAVTCPDVILQLHGGSYSHRHDLAEQLLHQIIGAPKRVVILQHPEDMAPLLLKKALERLASTPNLIIILTTHVGSRVIHSHLKQQAASAADQPSHSALDRALRHELETELDPGISEYVTAVAPFSLLGQPELQQILINKVSVSSQFVNAEITPALARIWTSSKHVEYLEWQSQGRTIQSFASRGAKVLDENIWQTLVAQYKRCRPQQAEPTATGKLMEFDWDEEEAVVSLCGDAICEEECRFPL